MRKSLLITLEYPPHIGGVSNYYYNLVSNLPKENISVLTNEKGQLLSKSLIFPWLKAFFTLKSMIKEKTIDVLLVGQILPLGTVAYLINRFYHVPYIVFTHAMDITWPQKYPRKKWLMKLILNHAEKIITVSRYTKYEIYKLIGGRGQRKIEVITPAPSICANSYVNLDITDLKNKFSQEKILLSVGRLVPRKGHDMVIRAMSLILKNHNKTKYIIIGDGEFLQPLKNLVAQLDLQRNVLFLGSLSDEEVAKYYKLCDVFIMPSRETEDRDAEGFGLVYLEANSFGKPVIGGKSGGVEDAIIDGQTGFLVEPKNINMIATAVTRLLSKDDLAKKLGENGKNRVEKEFIWSYKAEQLTKILSL
jgi:phosphatidylinositol alpha-1,6-mannosyltransferase